MTMPKGCSERSVRSASSSAASCQARRLSNPVSGSRRLISADLSECPQLCARQGVHAGIAILQPVHMQPAAGQVYLRPLQRD